MTQHGAITTERACLNCHDPHASADADRLLDRGGVFFALPASADAARFLRDFLARADLIGRTPRTPFGARRARSSPA